MPQKLLHAQPGITPLTGIHYLMLDAQFHSFMPARPDGSRDGFVVGPVSSGAENMGCPRSKNRRRQLSSFWDKRCTQGGSSSCGATGLLKKTFAGQQGLRMETTRHAETVRFKDLDPVKCEPHH